MDNYKVGNKIATFRRKQGLTGERFAEFLGVSPQAVSKWENGKCLPETSLLPMIAMVLNTSIDIILMSEKLPIVYADGTDDAEVLTKVYMGLNLNENKNISIIEEGIQKLLSLRAYNNAGELYLKLTGLNTLWNKSISIEKQMDYCEETLKYLDKSSAKYAYGISLHKYLNLENSAKSDIVIHYNHFSTQVKRSDKKITLSFTLHCSFLHSSIKNPLCFDSPVMRSYNYTTSKRRYYEKSKIIIDESLSVGEKNCLEDDYNENEVLTFISKNAVVTTQISEFRECNVFKYKCNDKIIENYFAPNIGLVRVVAKDIDGRTFVYELCDYTIKGGEGLFPLCVGNKWSYKQCDCPDWAGQIIEREIVGTDGDCYNISGLDYIYFKPEDYDTTDIATICNITQNTHTVNASKLYRILLHKIKTPQSLEIIRNRYKLINNGKPLPAWPAWKYLKINSVSVDRKYTNEANNDERLYFWFCGMTHTANHADSAVRVFKQASFCEGKLYDPLWKQGFEQKFNVVIKTVDADTVLTTHDLCEHSSIYEQWRKPSAQSEGKIIELPATIKVTNAGTVEVLSGTFDNCIKVDFDCKKPEDVCYFYPDQHLLYQSPFDVCGKKSIYYAPDVGIIKAEYDFDGELYTVELSEYVNILDNDEYMPVYYGNNWCYKVTNKNLTIKDDRFNDNSPVEISMKYTVSLPDEDNKNKFMLFEEYNRIRKKDSK